MQEQDREQGTLFRTAQWHLFTAVSRIDGAQDAELHVT